MCETGWSGVGADFARSSMNGRFLAATAWTSDSRSWKTKPLGFEPNALPAVVVPPTGVPEPPSSSIV
jgi:hypothetical protein